MYQSIIRPLLFMLDAEKAHHVGLGGLSLIDKFRVAPVVYRALSVADPRLEVTIGGLTFANPIGVAAGLDKDGVALAGLASLGFGSIEVGTVTAEAQTGNPLPRIFRLPLDKALINRMGFPSNGAVKLVEQLSQSLPLTVPARVGINIGKTKRVEIDAAAQDYLRTFEQVKRFGDYFVINVSSPNTPELRKLQEPERLRVLLQTIRQAGLDGRPLFVKITVDLEAQQLSEVVDTVVSGGATGIIVSNTTFSRENLRTVIDETGGLSGIPLFERARSYVARIYAQTNGMVPVIGVGGVFNGDQVWSMMEAGASAVQVYTGFIYEGPLMARRILKRLIERISQENLSSISSIIGRKNLNFTGE